MLIRLIRLITQLAKKLNGKIRSCLIPTELNERVNKFLADEDRTYSWLVTRSLKKFLNDRQKSEEKSADDA